MKAKMCTRSPQVYQMMCTRVQRYVLPLYVFLLYDFLSYIQLCDASRFLSIALSLFTHSRVVEEGKEEERERDAICDHLALLPSLFFRLHFDSSQSSLFPSGVTLVGLTARNGTISLSPGSWSSEDGRLKVFSLPKIYMQEAWRRCHKACR